MLSFEKNCLIMLISFIFFVEKKKVLKEYRKKCDKNSEMKEINREKQNKEEIIILGQNKIR